MSSIETDRNKRVHRQTDSQKDSDHCLSSSAFHARIIFTHKFRSIPLFHMTMKRKLALVGDSDIAFWPPELRPIIVGDSPTDTIVSAQGGLTLGECLPFLQKVLREDGGNQRQEIIIVACAGENDVGNGISLDNSVRSLESFLDMAFQDNGDGSSSLRRLVFLGPKFEPWLEDDPSYKKQYSKMSRSFQRCCQKHANADNIHYIDCLTMFCGDTATIPGAVLGGKACADGQYFASDKLHLSRHGYRIWKDVVEKAIQQSPAV